MADKCIFQLRQCSFKYGFKVILYIDLSKIISLNCALISTNTYIIADE